MSDLNVKSFAELRRRIYQTRQLLRSEITRQLRHWSLWMAFNDMVEFAVTTVPTWPGLDGEIARVPELLTHFVEALEKNANKHIDVEHRAVFDPSVMGRSEGYKKWQEDGYFTVRTAANHKQRLNIWRKLFDTGITPKGGGDRITYEQIIHSRDSSWDYTSGRIPYWYLWNYGNINVETGYPSYPGIHFIEHGLFRIDAHEEIAGQALSAYITEFFLTGRSDPPSILRDESWRRVYRGR